MCGAARRDTIHLFNGVLHPLITLARKISMRHLLKLGSCRSERTISLYQGVSCSQHYQIIRDTQM